MDIINNKKFVNDLFNKTFSTRRTQKGKKNLDIDFDFDDFSERDTYSDESAVDWLRDKKRSSDEY